MIGRLTFVSVASLCLLFVSGFCGTTSLFADGSCAGYAPRAGLSALLPDCRAYELVTSPQKDSSEPKAVPVGFHERNGLEAIEGTHASVEGNRIAWDSEYSLPGSSSPGLDYLSTRKEAGWSTENVIPPQTTENGLLCLTLVGMVGWSSDLSKGVLADGVAQEKGSEAFLNETEECGHDEPRLVEGEPEGFQNLFVRNNIVGSYELVNVTPGDAAVPKRTSVSQEYFPANFLAGSSDLSHVVFEEELPLTPNAGDGDELYAWTTGTLRLVTIVANRPVPGSLAGATRNKTHELAAERFVPVNVAAVRHAVSADGSRIFFEAEGNLYVREDGTKTVEVDMSQGTGPGGGGRFMGANADGTRVFFTDDASAGLTLNTVSGSGMNLYEYETETGKLTDITPVSGAAVQGVSGLSEDGLYVYFVADGVLTDRPNPEDDRAVAGEPNLYLFHNGVTALIATLDASADLCDWTSNTGCLPGGVPETSGLTARVSANGAFIGFNSIKRLTGYDNVDEATSKADNEIFLYEASADRLICVSCSPSGPPIGGGAAIRWPARPDTNEDMRNAYPQRNVSDGGQVFFETLEALLPQDSDGMPDVYEYGEGKLHLISSGVSEAGSYFLDATPSGSDVFFATTQRLLPNDTDGVYDIYDARVGGGFSEPPASLPPCSGEGCRIAAAGVPSFLVPGSIEFLGPGNVRPASIQKGPRHKRLRVVHHKKHKHGKKSRYISRRTRRTGIAHRRGVK